MKNNNAKAKWGKIPQEGMSEELIDEILSNLIKSNHYQIPSGNPTARPITRVNPFAAYAQNIVQTSINANLCAPYIYDSIIDITEETRDMLLNLMHHPASEDGGAVFLKSGTQSITQAIQLYLVQYYNMFGFDIRKNGLLEAAKQDIPIPIILSPLNANIALEKAVELVGIGKNQIAKYNLNDNFSTDYESLTWTLEKLHKEQKRIAVNFILAGDTERGKIQNVQKISGIVSDMCKNFGYNPPTVVDATAQWLNLAMCRNAELWDFRNEAVKGIIIDPHKIELPYDSSVLLLRNYEDLSVLGPAQPQQQLQTTPSLSRKRYLEAHANMVVARGGAQTIALYAYLLNQGMQGLAKSRKKIMALADMLADYIRQSSCYMLNAEPETSVVAWTSKSDEPEANWIIAQAINNGKDGLFIAYSPVMRIRTLAQLEDYKRDSSRKYDGLHAHIMEHNTEKGIGLLCRKLDEAGMKLMK